MSVIGASVCLDEGCMQLAQTMRVTSKSHTIPYEIMYDITKVCSVRLYMNHIVTHNQQLISTALSHRFCFPLIADIIHSFLPPSQRETEENFILPRWSL